MKKLITIMAALAVSVTFATAADAEKPKGEKKAARNPEETFKKLDADADGKLSLDELKAGPVGKKDPTKADSLLKHKDKDGDGKLSLDEFKAGGGKKGAKEGDAKPTGGAPEQKAKGGAGKPAPGDSGNTTAPAEKK